MGDFITSDTEPELYDDKTPAPNLTLRPDWNTTNILTAAQANGIKDALFDVREAIRTQLISGDIINVPLLGADMTGAVDATTIVQAALDAADGASGKKVLLGAGRLKLSATLDWENVEGASLIGAGLNQTTLVPTAAMDGLPLLKCNNVRFCHFEGFRIGGIDDSGTTKLDCAIQFHTEDVVDGRVSTNNTVQDVRIGTDDVVGLTDGIRFTCGGAVGGAHDINNDAFHLTRVSIYNCDESAISIEHNNSLCHDITDCVLSNVGVGVDAPNGSFAMKGGFIIATEALFKIGGGSNYEVLHACLLNGVQAENKTASEAPKTIVIEGDAAKVYMVGCELLGGRDESTNMVEITADDVEFSAESCWLGYGQPTQIMSVTGDGCFVKFKNCHLGFTTYEWGAGGGILWLENNFHEPGVITELMDPAGYIVQFGDIGGGYSYNEIRGFDLFSGNKVWTDTSHTMTSADEQAIIMQRNGTIGGRSSPIFYWGRIDGGLTGTTPRCRYLYSDGSIVERPIWELNYQGQMGTLLDGTRRAIYYGKIDPQDSANVFELSATPAMQLGMGNGGTDAIDTFVRRTGTSELSLMVGTSPAAVAKATSTGFNIPTGKSLTVTDSAYSNAIRFGSYYLWVDASGRLRIHSSAPVSESDGTIVGTQS